jgi:hypothetical protein
MKRTLALVLMVFGSFGAFAADDNHIVFSLDCKVINQTILSLEDGKSSQFGQYTDGFKIGDIFPITFEYLYNPEFKSYLLTISSSDDRLDTYNKMRGYDKAIEPSFDDSLFVKYISRYEWLYMDESYIAYKKDARNGDIYLNRYFKNDWELLYTYKGSTQHHTLAANCMNMPTKYLKLLKTLQKQPSYTSD